MSSNILKLEELTDNSQSQHLDDIYNNKSLTQPYQIQGRKIFIIKLNAKPER